MDTIKVNVVVIGSGPAGQKAAIQAAKLGKQVVVLEADEFLGGACVNSGTIPSKTLRAAILDLTNFYAQSFYGQEAKRSDISINDLNYRLDHVLNMQRELIKRQFDKNKIRYFFGSASFKSDKEVLLERSDGKSTVFEAEHIIIATGSQPRNPEDIPFDDTVILDSNRLLKIDQVPKRMLVLGGGIIGSEYASFFAALGTKVTLIDKKKNMLPLLDHEIGLHVQKGLSNIGLNFVGEKKIKSISKNEHGKACIACEDGTALCADVLLYALGRVARVEGLNIENAGLQLNSHGHISVNPLFQTKVSNIYAIGDVIGRPSLASTSMEQGRLAARNLCEVKSHQFPDVVPIGIYSIPEISYCGYSEEEVKAKNINYEIGRAYYYEITASHIYGVDEVGMFKIIFHKDTLEILGIHIVGRNATELIHIGQVAMSFNSKITYFADQIFNYPTYAEGYRIAALNGYNKVKER